MVKLKTASVIALLFATTYAAGINLGGYVQGQWGATLTQDSLSQTFSVRRAFLCGWGPVSDHFSYCVLLTLTGQSISLYNAYVNIKPIEQLTLRIGQFQMPIGKKNLTPSSEILFPERPYTCWVSHDCDAGAMLWGKVKWGSLQAGIFNGQGRNQVDVDTHKDMVGRLVLTPWDFLYVGGSYQIGKRPNPDSSATEAFLGFDRWGGEFTVTPWDLWLMGELRGGNDGPVSLLTYYLEAAWMFKTDAEWFYGIQPAVRYESIDFDISNDGNSGSIITAGINFHFLPKHQAKLALCYRIIAEENAEVDNDQIIAQMQLKFP